MAGIMFKAINASSGSDTLKLRLNYPKNSGLGGVDSKLIDYLVSLNKEDIFKVSLCIVESLEEGRLDICALIDMHVQDEYKGHPMLPEAMMLGTSALVDQLSGYLNAGHPFDLRVDIVLRDEYLFSLRDILRGSLNATLGYQLEKTKSASTMIIDTDY